MTDMRQTLMDVITMLQAALDTEERRKGKAPKVYHDGPTDLFFCGGCGAAVHWGDRFCRMCGEGVNWDG